MKLQIGLVGAGTIATGVAEIIKGNSELIERRTGYRLMLKRVYARDKLKAENMGVLREIITSDYNDIINDKDIDVLVELMGGIEPAKSIILAGIRAKKGIVTANKALIAAHGAELFREAAKNNVTINFEGAVGGAIPIIKSIRESFITDRLRSIYGILNGTTNFILTRMEAGLSYDDALKKAQMLGFAEANPSFDVDGHDAAQKILILARLAYNTMAGDSVPSLGISKIRQSDISYARELGYKIKLLAVAKLDGNELDIRVQPMMIPLAHALAGVNNELNAVYTYGEQAKETMFYGSGAGKLATATVVVSDIIDVAKKKSDENTSFFNNYNLKDADNIISRFYIRFMLLDRPGSFASIAKVLGDNDISINAVTQKEQSSPVVPVIVITHDALHRNIKKALKDAICLDVVKEEPFYLMIEDF